MSVQYIEQNFGIFYECPNVQIKVAVNESMGGHFKIPQAWSRIIKLFSRMTLEQQEEILVNTVDTLQVRSFVKLNRDRKAEVEEELWGTKFWKVRRLKRKDYM